jgi:gliding motility-associated-like protein
MKKTFILISLLVCFYNSYTQAQNVLCNQANPFCTGTTYNFPAGVNAGTAEVGANYGCLFTQPNPAWYYMQVGTSGTIEITMNSTPAVDIDFACWGPFPNQTSPCVAQLTAGTNTPNHTTPGPSPDYPTLNMVDCSYSINPTEYCYIPNAVSGTFYILLITNYSNDPCNIDFSQTGGTGNTNCGILAPPITGDTVCEGQTLNLHVNSPTSGASYSWTGPNGFTSNVMNPTLTNATTAMTGTYSLVITIGTQVSPPVTCNAIVNPNPVISISPANPSTCTGSPIDLVPSSTIPFTWYSWSTGVQGAGGITVSPTTPTTYSLIGTDQNGCADTTSVTVNISPDLILSVTPPNPSICFGASIDLTGNGANTYTWLPTTNLSSSNGTMVTASPTVTTIYTVSGVDTISGCTGVTTVTVNINPDLILSVNPPNPTICIGTSIALTAMGADTYTWSPTDSLSSGSGSNVIASPVITTTYTVNGTDAAGCTGTTTVTLTVDPPPNITITATPNHVCPGDSSVLSISLLATNYTWSPATTLSNPNAQFTTARPITTTTYTVVADNSGCTSTATFTLEVKPIPDVDFSADVREGCLPLKVHFQDLTSPAAGNWNWSFGDNINFGSLSNLQNPMLYFPVAGEFDVSLSVVTVDGCKWGITLPDYIIVHPLPQAEFDLSPQKVNEVDPLVLFFDQSIGAKRWNWYFGEKDPAHNTSFLQNSAHVYSDTGAYIITLVVFNDYGCSDTAQRAVNVEQNISFYIPNAFSPSENGKNPNFKLYGEGIDLSTFEMRIFDRWGEQVCFTRDLEEGWDGRIKGNKIGEPGMYAYLVSFYDIKYRYHNLKGFVMLLK